MGRTRGWEREGGAAPQWKAVDWRRVARSSAVYAAGGGKEGKYGGIRGITGKWGGGGQGGKILRDLAVGGGGLGGVYVEARVTPCLVGDTGHKPPRTPRINLG